MCAVEGWQLCLVASIDAMMKSFTEKATAPGEVLMRPACSVGHYTDLHPAWPLHGFSIFYHFLSFVLFLLSMWLLSVSFWNEQHNLLGCIFIVIISPNYPGIIHFVLCHLCQSHCCFVLLIQFEYYSWDISLSESNLSEKLSCFIKSNIQLKASRTSIDVQEQT